MARQIGSGSAVRRSPQAILLGFHAEATAMEAKATKGVTVLVGEAKAAEDAKGRFGLVTGLAPAVE